MSRLRLRRRAFIKCAWGPTPTRCGSTRYARSPRPQALPRRHDGTTANTSRMRFVASSRRRVVVSWRSQAVGILCMVLWLSPGLAAQSSWVPKVRAWIAANEQPVMRELLELLSIPNIAADRANILRNAEHLRGLFQRRGFTVELLETAGNPLVYAELKVAGATRTLLLYSHYDGQPVNPTGWRQPDPFTPVVRDGRIYARSASDDKSPIIMTLAAIDALTAAGSAPTSNIRVILDGEEEAGSPSL